MKAPAQPLVFCFSGVSSLCGAVEQLYARYPGIKAGLCLYRGRYYLAVHAGFLERRRVFLTAGGYGGYLGPAPVLYAYYAEHGSELSRNAVEELGALLQE